MGPITQHLRSLFPELPQAYDDVTRRWVFDVSLNALEPAAYAKLLPLHPLLNLEYSILCAELRHDFLNLDYVNKNQIQARLINALILCELLKHLHQHYLVVPQEVARLNKQQQVFRSVLTALTGLNFATNLLDIEQEAGSEFSISQHIRLLTMQANWYRILVNRSKRVVNLLNNVITCSPAFNKFVANLDTYANPFLAYFGLFFHVPRLLTFCFSFLKHTIPGPWMNQKEASIPAITRFYSQWLRRWFELGNDSVWTLNSALNMFVLVGAAATGAVYLSTAAFAFDVANAFARAYVELKRLYTLYQHYEDCLFKAKNQEQREFIANHLNHIEKRIKFEQMRFAIHVLGTVLIFGAMALALPFLMINPIVLLASALFLVILWGTTFELTRRLDKYRPNDTIEMPKNLSTLSFFALKKPKTACTNINLKNAVEPTMSVYCTDCSRDFELDCDTSGLEISI